MLVSIGKKKYIKNNFLYYSWLLKKKQLNYKFKKQTLIKYKKNVMKYEFQKNLNTKLFIKKNIESLKTKQIIENFFACLTRFTSKKLKIFLILHKLNDNIKYVNNIKKIIKKKVIKLRKYKENLFFYSGIKILFTAISNSNSSKLLSQFIATQLKFLRRHNFFFKFIKDIFSLFKNKIFSKIKSIKIKIKGKLNGRARSRIRVIKINNGIKLISINSIINYHKTISHTVFGTFGVKVWIQEYYFHY